MIRKNKQNNKTGNDIFDIEKELTFALHEEDNIPNDARLFMAIIQPKIRAKCIYLQEHRKRRRDIALLAAAYAAFILIIALFIWNYLIFGFNRTTVILLGICGTVAITLLCCLPLIMKFKLNIFERGSY